MARPKLDDVVTDYRETGCCLVDCDVVEKLWSGLWVINQWKDEFRLVKYKRKDSPNTSIKVTISEFQAREIISRLCLVGTQNTTFRAAVTWRPAL